MSASAIQTTATAVPRCTFCGRTGHVHTWHDPAIRRTPCARCGEKGHAEHNERFHPTPRTFAQVRAVATAVQRPRVTASPALRVRDVLPKERACSICGEMGHRADNQIHKTGSTAPSAGAVPAADAAPAPRSYLPARPPEPPAAAPAAVAGPAIEPSRPQPTRWTPANDGPVDDADVMVIERARQMGSVGADGRRRAATVPARATAKERRSLVVVDDADLDGARPRTREDCRNGPRPCPFVSCAHHLYLDVNADTGAIKFNFPHLDVWQMAETCSLDVADRGGITLEEVGNILNLTRERIRQVETKGIDRLRARLPVAAEPDAPGPGSYNTFNIETP